MHINLPPNFPVLIRLSQIESNKNLQNKLQHEDMNILFNKISLANTTRNHINNSNITTKMMSGMNIG